MNISIASPVNMYPLLLALVCALAPVAGQAQDVTIHAFQDVVDRYLEERREPGAWVA